MRLPRPVSLSILALLALGFVPAASSAQSSANYSVGLMLGVGGSTDAEPDTEFGNVSFQAYFAMKTQPKTEFVARLGQLALDTEGSFFDADLTYLTLTGEYEFPGGGYESGLFLGLGIYNLNGDFGIDDESALGLTVGTTGDFRLTDRLSLMLELSGHYADLDYAQFFLMGHVGIAYHF